MFSRRGIFQAETLATNQFIWPICPAGHTFLFINHRFIGGFGELTTCIENFRAISPKKRMSSLYRGTLVVWWGHKDFQDLRVSLENLEVGLWWVWLSKDHVSTHAQAVKTRNLQCSIRSSHKTLHWQMAGTATAVSLSSCLAAATLCRANAR